MTTQASDLDWQIRAAAFQALSEMVARHGPVLNWDQISQGFTMDGQQLMFASRARGIFWPKQMTGSLLSIRSGVPRQTPITQHYETLEKDEDFSYRLSPNERDQHRMVMAHAMGSPLIYFFGIAPSAYRPIWPVFVRGVDRERMECRIIAGDGTQELQKLGVPKTTILKPEFRIQLAEVNRELLAYLAKHPDALRELAPRKFEEVVAEILRNQGFEVLLTAQTRDGGRDIQAARKDSLGTFMYYVECKQYAKARHVSVDIVRALYGVVQHDRATAGIIATTSSFTADAIGFAKSIQYQLSLKDFESLKDWLNAYR